MTPPDKMKIVYRKTSSLIPYVGNARVHPPEQIEQIRASIREFGFRNPILLKDDGKTIGAGHGRWEAAKAEGMATVPTITLTGLTDAQWRAYVIIDNQSALLAEWDWAKLNVEVAALKVEDFDISLLGFDSFDLKNIYMADVPGDDDKPDADEVPEPPKKPVSKLGDVWLLGAYYECEACGKHYSKEQGDKMRACPCDEEA